MSTPTPLNDFNFLVEFIELAKELGGKVVIQGNQLPPKLIAKAIAAATQETTS